MSLEKKQKVKKLHLLYSVNIQMYLLERDLLRVYIQTTPFKFKLAEQNKE